MKTDLRRERSEATREALLGAGATLFATRGYAGTSLDAIAGAAGVNKALIKYHFGGKRELYSAVLLAPIAAAREEFAAVGPPSDPPQRRLGQYIDALVRMFRRHPHFPFIVLREEMSGGLSLEPAVLREFMSFFLLDREILEAGMKRGVFRRVDPHATHLSLVGSLVFFLVTEPFRMQIGRIPEVGEDNPELDAYVEHVKQLLLQGLQP